MEKLSIESIEGDNYLPLHGRNYKPRRKDQPAPKEEEMQFPDEWKDAMSQATDKDIQELAGTLSKADTRLYNQRFFTHPFVYIYLVTKQSSIIEKF